MCLGTAKPLDGIIGFAESDNNNINLDLKNWKQLGATQSLFCRATAPLDKTAVYFGKKRFPIPEGELSSFENPGSVPKGKTKRELASLSWPTSARTLGAIVRFSLSLSYFSLSQSVVGLGHRSELF